MKFQWGGDSIMVVWWLRITYTFVFLWLRRKQNVAHSTDSKACIIKLESSKVGFLAFGAYCPMELMNINLPNTLALDRWWWPLLFFFSLFWIILHCCYFKASQIKLLCFPDIEITMFVSSCSCLVSVTPLHHLCLKLVGISLQFVESH